MPPVILGRPEMKALMQDLGPDFKFPEWKCPEPISMDMGLIMDGLVISRYIDIEIIEIAVICNSCPIVNFDDHYSLMSLLMHHL